MNQEKYCARHIGVIEGETFLAIASNVGRNLHPEFTSERKQGRALRLPDLLSVKREGLGSVFRLREVKFKLHEALVRKALGQLQVGVEQLQQREKDPVIDRLEIVVPLQNRTLSDAERRFLGEPLGGSRFQLMLSGGPVTLHAGNLAQAVTVLVI